MLSRSGQGKDTAGDKTIAFKFQTTSSLRSLLLHHAVHCQVVIVDAQAPEVIYSKGASCRHVHEQDFG